MKKTATTIAIVSLLLLVWVTSAVAIEPTCAAEEHRRKLATSTRNPNLDVPSRYVTTLVFHAPGEHSADVLSIFRLHVTRVVPLPWPLRGLRERLRPYVLGGQTTVRLPASEGLSRYANRYEDSTTLHVGGGTEVLLGDHLALSVDLAEVIHGGSLSELSHERYNVGLNWAF